MGWLGCVIKYTSAITAITTTIPTIANIFVSMIITYPPSIYIPFGKTVFYEMLILVFVY